MRTTKKPYKPHYSDNDLRNILHGIESGERLTTGVVKNLLDDLIAERVANGLLRMRFTPVEVLRRIAEKKP